MTKVRLYSSALVAALTLALAPSALAQSPAKSGYDETGVIETLPETESGRDIVPPVGDVLPAESGGGDVAPAASRRETGGQGGASAPATSAGSLPFTGLDVGLIALMGVALLATGAVLRRGRASRS